MKYRVHLKEPSELRVIDADGFATSSLGFFRFYYNIKIRRIFWLVGYQKTVFYVPGDRILSVTEVLK